MMQEQSSDTNTLLDEPFALVVVLSANCSRSEELAWTLVESLAAVRRAQFKAVCAY